MAHFRGVGFPNAEIGGGRGGSTRRNSTLDGLLCRAEITPESNCGDTVPSLKGSFCG